MVVAFIPFCSVVVVLAPIGKQRTVSHRLVVMIEELLAIVIVIGYWAAKSTSGAIQTQLALIVHPDGGDLVAAAFP